MVFDKIKSRYFRDSIKMINEKNEELSHSISKQISLNRGQSYFSLFGTN